MTTTEYLARGHENIGRLLLVLDSHLSRPLSGEEPDVRLMQRIADYVIDYVERQHLPVEELVLARLDRRERWLHALLEAHARELRELRLAMARFSGLLAGACVDPDYDRDKLTRAGLALIATMRKRLAVEDIELLPVAEDALEAEDWRSIEATVRTRGVREEPWDDEHFKAMFTELVTVAGCGCEYS